MEKLVPPAEPKKSIFVSHAYADNDTCRVIAAGLRDRGYEVWLDLEQDYAGHEISQVVREALIARDTLLVVLSDAALNSRWVREEYAFFRDYPNRPRPIVSVKLGDCHLHAKPHLALSDPSASRGIELEDLAAIDATRLALDELITKLDARLMAPPHQLRRVKLTEMTEREFTDTIHALLPAIYGSGRLAMLEPGVRAADRRFDIIASNTYTLFPGRYIIELKVWSNPERAARAAQEAVRQLVTQVQRYEGSLQQAGIEEEVFAFLFTLTEIPKLAREDAHHHNVRTFDGPRLVRLLRDNGFDVEL